MILFVCVDDCEGKVKKQRNVTEYHKMLRLRHIFFQLASTVLIGP